MSFSTTGATLLRIHLLVVEDDDRLRRLLTRLFEEQRHVVEAAMDGREALELAEIGDGIDVVILDIGLPIYFRLGSPIVLNLRHRLVVVHVVNEAAGVVSVYIGGRHLDALPARAGQFFQWRVLTGGGWWRAHPYSLSAGPDGRYLRITIKGQGVDSHLAQQLRPGIRVLAEGPYGAFTADRLTRPSALFIAGGIGITPLRAMLDELPRDHGDVVLIYRASSWHDVAFRGGLDAIAGRRRVRVLFLVGHRGDSHLQGEPLSPESISRLVPDVGVRDVFVSGSEGFLSYVNRSLRTLGLRGDQVHVERFAF